MPAPVFPARCFARPLHGVQLLAADGPGQQQAPPPQERDDISATLPVWREAAEPATDSDPAWSREEQGERYRTLLQLHQAEQGWWLKIACEGTGAFHCTPDGMGVYWQRDGTGPEHYFQTLGLGLWLEQRGIPCIHANALAKGDAAIGLMAPSRGGKSTLTAALLESGMQLMTDDMLALHPEHGAWRVYPGWPQLRMWPDSARQYAGDNLQALARVHERFAKRVVDLEHSANSLGPVFCGQPQTLQTLYLLDRYEPGETGEEGIRIDEIAPAQAMLHMLQNSILGDAYRALGVEPARLGLLGRLLEDIPLKKIRYPGGLQFLPKVCEKIVGALAT